LDLTRIFRPFTHLSAQEGKTAHFWTFNTVRPVE